MGGHVDTACQYITWPVLQFFTYLILLHPNVFQLGTVQHTTVVSRKIFIFGQVIHKVFIQQKMNRHRNPAHPKCVPAQSEPPQDVGG